MDSTSGMGELGTGKEGENGISERKETEKERKKSLKELLPLLFCTVYGGRGTCSTTWCWWFIGVEVSPLQ